MNKNKKGQMTIWIIVAVAIIVLAIIGFFVYNYNLKYQIERPMQELNPNIFMGECLGDYIEPIVMTMSKQGGYLAEPAIFIPYNGSKVGYLCYTNEAYKICYNQQPFLDKFIEQQLKEELKKQNAVKNCLINFESRAKGMNYQITRCQGPDFNVTLTNNEIITNFDCAITLTKNDKTQRYEKVEAVYAHPLGEFIALAMQIVDKEITLGEFNLILGQFYNPNIEILRIKAEKTKIYVLHKLNTDKSFVFGVKNLFQPVL